MNNALRHGSGQLLFVPKLPAVGDARPMSTAEGNVSGDHVGKTPVPRRQPYPARHEVHTRHGMIPWQPHVPFHVGVEGVKQSRPR
jgi:hypothetical protein